MRRFRKFALVLAGILPLTPVHAQDAEATIGARQALMTVQGYNIGILGGMARERIPYDAALATTAATNLAAIGMMDHTLFWPEGTDSDFNETRALPVIWEQMDDFMAEWDSYAVASAAMAEAAGGGLDSLRSAMGPLGSACGDCHETYRQPRN